MIVLGARETIVALNKLDRELRKEFNKQARALAKPIIDNAKRGYTQVPLSGMSRNWSQNGRPKFPFTVPAARKGVKFKIDTSKRLKTGPARPVGIISVRQDNPAAVIFDMAGKASTNALSQQLTARWGGPSRVMWPAAEQELPNVQRGVRDLVNDAERTIQRQVNRAG